MCVIEMWTAPRTNSGYRVLAVGAQRCFTSWTNYRQSISELMVVDSIEGQVVI
jgi:hypothetical protein